MILDELHGFYNELCKLYKNYFFSLSQNTNMIGEIG